MRTSFWTYFTSGYGILWLLLLTCSLLTQTHIDAGVFGLIGFPVIALLYALLRRSSDASNDTPVNPKWLGPKMEKFLEAKPEMRNLSRRDRIAAFEMWMNEDRTV